VTGLVINITSPGFGTDSAQEPSGAEFIVFSCLLTNGKKNYFPKSFGFEKKFYYILNISVKNTVLHCCQNLSDLGCEFWHRVCAQLQARPWQLARGSVGC